MARRLSKSGLLNLLAVLADQPVPWRVLLEQGAAQQEAPLVRVRQAVEAELAELDVLESAVVSDVGVSLSATLRERTLRDMAQDDRRRSIAEAAARLRAAFPAHCHDVSTWPICQQLAPHAQAVVEHAPEAGAVCSDVLWLLERLATYMIHRGTPEGARKLLEAGVALAEGAASEDGPLRVLLRLSLAEALNDLGEPAQARALVEQALRCSDIADSDPALRAQAHLQAGVALESLGDVEAARRETQAAVDLLEERLPGGFEHARAVERLASMKHLQGDHQGARSLLELALANAMQSRGPAHPDAAGLRSTLGVVLLALGEQPAALAELTRAVNDAAAALGGDHPEVAVARSNLSSALVAGGSLEDAKLQLTLSIAAVEGVLPPSHEAFHTRHGKLAEVLERLGDTAEAVRHREMALDVSGLAGERAATQLARDHAALAKARIAGEDLPGARVDYEQALAIGIAAPADARGRLPLAFYARDLAAVLRALGELPEALARQVQALELHGGEDPADRWTVFDRLTIADAVRELAPAIGQGLAALHRADLDHSIREATGSALTAAAEEAIANGEPKLLLLAGRFATAGGDVGLAARALEHAAEQLAELGEDPARAELYGVLISEWRGLGQAHGAQDRWPQAQRCLEQALATLKDSPLSAPRAEGTVLYELAVAHRRQGGLDRAVALFEDAVASNRDADARSQDLVFCLHALGRTLARMGRNADAESSYRECLEILHSEEQPNHKWVGVTLHDLGDIRRSEARTEQAMTLYEEAAAHKRQVAHTLDLAVTLEQLALTSLACGTTSAARAIALEAASLLERPGTDRPLELVRMLAVAASTSRGRADAALQLLHRAAAAEVDPGADVWTTALRAEVHEEHGHVEEAMLLRSAVTASLKDAAPMPGEPTLDSALQAAQILTLAGAHDRARDSLEDASRIAGDAPAEQLVRTLAERWRLLGFRLMRSERFKDARGALQRALDLASSIAADGSRLRASVLYFLADTRRAEGQLRAAIDAYGEAAREAKAAGRTPDQVAALIARGRAFLACGEQESAAAIFEEAFASAARLEERDLHLEGVALHDLAVARSRQGHEAQASDLLRHAVERKRSHGDCMHSLAASLIGSSRALLIAGEVVDAASAARQAAQILRQALATPTGLLGPRDELHQVAPAPWPAEGPALESAHAALEALSPQALGLLERVCAGRAHPDGTDAPAARAELRELKLIERDRSALSQLGRDAAALLRGPGAPPPRIVERLRADLAPWWRLAIDGGVLLARLAAGPTLPSARALLDGLTLPAGIADGPHARVDSVAALAVAAGIAGDLGGAAGPPGPAGAAARAGIASLDLLQEPRLLPALGIACVDLGELERAQELLEHAANAPAGSPRGTAVGPDGVQLGLAWHWLAAAREARGDPLLATSLYDRAAAEFAGCHLEAERRTLGILADIAGDDRTQLDRVPERVRALPWTPTHDARASRVARLLQLSRLLLLVGERLAARATLAFALNDVRLTQRAASDLRPAGEIDRAAVTQALAGLSAPAVAMLERLRADDAISRKLGAAPGLSASPGCAWIAMRALVELESAALCHPDAVPGWFALTPSGHAAAASLLPS